VVSLDRVPYHMAAAAPPRVAADALALPFAPGSFDYVASSLFLHHFSDGQAVELLAAFLRIARRAVVAIDLERSPLLHFALPALGTAMGWCAVTRHDARRSVEAAFRASELAALARAAGARSVRVRSFVPWFRLSLVASA
jgi:ubiquinone/menaquinone biosynthesis C-methylase UbiE